ncbi:MAG: antitoxin [Planctomycetota bacterium]
MKKGKSHQYTIRAVPPDVDQALRRKARASGKSLNEIVLDVLARETSNTAEPKLHHDLDFLAGTWVEDPEFDRILEEQRQIDWEQWR